MDRVIKIENPELVDRVINQIQDGLANNLPWLNHVFGRAERLVKSINGKKYYEPHSYITGNEYIPLSPDSHLGNFCFFLVDDPDIINWVPGMQSGHKYPVSIVFWFDMRTITNSANNRNIEAVKLQIMRILNGGFWLRSGNLVFNRVYEKAENIYKGFNIDEIDNQFLMHPFAGLRFEGEIEISEPCIE